MAIKFNKKNQRFELISKSYLYAFEITPDKYLRHLYFGKIVENYPLYKNDVVGDCNSFLYHNKEEKFSLSGMSNEYPSFGMGDYKEVALKYTLIDGSRNNNLKYVSHQIHDFKTPIKNMPSLKGDNELVIKLNDNNVDVYLYYSVYEDEDIISRRVIIKNKGDKIILNTINSFCLDLKGVHDVISLSGWWAHERNIVKHEVNQCILNIDSKRGITSHQQNNAIVVVDKDTDEYSGLAIGFNLIYSSSFSFKVEHTSFNDFRIVGGINDYDFSYPLNKNESFQTPEVVIGYSDVGLNKMSQNYHDLYRKYLMNSNFVNKPRPIVLNNWEATCFDFTISKLKNMIETAKEVGIDTFVLDDGWFGKRNDDKSSLGDWFINKEKLPNGLNELITICKNNGIKFGLWIEPEMISEDSQLYRTHPAWAIKSPYGIINTQRNQLVLNFTKKEVREYIKNLINELLDTYEISYIKWDCNRYPSEFYADNLKSDEQSSLFHRNIVEIYKLMDEIILTHPNVFFEGCSAGGMRFDPAMLSYFPQIWCSDNSDAYSRMYIQYGTSVFYPLSSFSGHVSKVPNQQVGTVTPLKTRINMANLCSTGYELDITLLSKEELNIIKENNKLYINFIKDLILYGDTYRILNPFEDNYFAINVVNKDKSKAYLVIQNKQLNISKGTTLHFIGLDENKHYLLNEDKTPILGKVLIEKGIKINFACDYDSFAFVIKESV